MLLSFELPSSSSSSIFRSAAQMEPPHHARRPSTPATESSSGTPSDTGVVARSDSHVVAALQKMRTDLDETTTRVIEHINRFRPITSGLSDPGDDTPFYVVGSSTFDAIKETVDTLQQIRHRNYLNYQHLNDKLADFEAKDAANAEVHGGRCVKDARRMQLKNDLQPGCLGLWEKDRFKELYGVAYHEVLQHIQDIPFIEVTNWRSTAVMDKKESNRKLAALKAQIKRYHDYVLGSNLSASPTNMTPPVLSHLYLRIRQDFARLCPRYAPTTAPSVNLEHPIVDGRGDQTPRTEANHHTNVGFNSPPNSEASSSKSFASNVVTGLGNQLRKISPKLLPRIK
jgi:hypothetical protein